MENSRKENSIRNIVCGIINKIVVLFFPFIIRLIIIDKLGSEYLGLSSLFTSILQILNLTELGFSSAIVFSMYKPIAQNDSKTICALMNLYKIVYRVIGLIILITGISLVPFLPKLIKGTYPKDISIYILYFMYLFNTVITYFLFAYKSALLTAHQRNDIISNTQTIIYILQYIMEIIILCAFKNYYLYILVSIFSSILNNLIIAYIVNKKYPNYKGKGKLSLSLQDDIKKRTIGLMIHKLCQTSRNSLDNIFISAFLGLNVVAKYGNYYTIMATFTGILTIIPSSILPSVGNSIVTEKKEKNYNDMNKFNFIYMWISGLCTIILLCLYQPIMKLWMGGEYLFNYGIVILFCIYFYVLKMGDIRGTYSDAKGLWWENRYRAIIESIANIILNFILVKYMGIYGIILGTLISLFIINFLYGSQILFKYYFTNQKKSEYFIRHLFYAFVTLVNSIITLRICTLITIDGIVGTLLKLIICLILSNIIYLLAYFKTNYYKKLK